jgi:CHAT domain-containing protein
VIIPHEDLNKLPFQVLENPDDSTHLGERFQISYVPSATVLSELGAQPDFPHGRLLALADPHITSAAAEVTALGTIYPPSRSKIVPGPLARKEDVMNWSPDYNLLHLSVHGHFDSLDPMLSYLELRPSADNGHFTAAEMFGLRLPRNSLVVLSACETGRVEVTHSNEVLGMVRGLLYAGASNVVLSSWSVDAKSTALWMTTFYREAQTKPPSEAAQLALLAVKNDPQYQHPFYWAPFLLTGR